MPADLAVRTAAGLLVLTGLGFGLPAVACIRSLANGQGIPIVFGFPAYGGGPFERSGIETTIPLVAAFLVVCCLELVAAWLLWDGRAAGAWLSLALIPAGAVFWWGFALPFPPLFAIARTALLLYGWATLR
jgi:hypothetical protein